MDAKGAPSVNVSAVMVPGWTRVGMTAAALGLAGADGAALGLAATDGTAALASADAIGDELAAAAGVAVAPEDEHADRLRTIGMARARQVSLVECLIWFPLSCVDSLSCSPGLA
jgi:hypothetical protein